MHSQSTVAEVLALRAGGFGARRIAARTNLPLATVRDWLAGRIPKHSRALDPTAPVVAACDQCGHPEHRFDQLPHEYVYLLGLYLGDGCISEHARSVFRLRVFLDLRYPRIVDDCESAMKVVVPQSRVHRLERKSNYIVREDPSNVEVSSFSKSWPCWFPQHGRGRSTTDRSR